MQAKNLCLMAIMSVSLALQDLPSYSQAAASDSSNPANNSSKNFSKNFSKIFSKTFSKNNNLIQAGAPASARRDVDKQRVPPVTSKPSALRGSRISLNTTFRDQNAVLPLVMHTLERNLNGSPGVKTAFDRAFDRVMAQRPQADRALLKKIVLNYNNLPAEIRSRGIAPEFQHLDARQPLNIEQVRAAFLQRHLIRPAADLHPAVAPTATRLSGSNGARLPLKTMLRIATAAGFDMPGSAGKGLQSQLLLTPYDLNHVKLSGGKVVSAAIGKRGANVLTPQQLQANADTIQQILQSINNPRLDAIIKKGGKNGIILPGSTLYLRGSNFGDQKDQIQIQIWGTLPGGFVGLQTPAFAPDIVASKGSQQELQVTVPTALPAGDYSLKVATGGNVSNGLALSVNKTPPPAPQITTIGSASAGEMLALSGSNFKATPGIPFVQFVHGKGEPTDIVPELKGLEALTDTAAFVQLPEDLPGGDYQVTYIKGWSDNLALDGVSNTVTIHVTGAPVPQLAPSPDNNGIYSVYPGGTVVVHGSDLMDAGYVRPLDNNVSLVLTPLDGDNLEERPSIFPLPGGSAGSIPFMVPAAYRPGRYTAQIRYLATIKGQKELTTEPVTLQINPYHYDGAFTDLNFNLGEHGSGQYFVVLTCIRDTQGYALTTGNHAFDSDHQTFALGDDGSMFKGETVYDRLVVSAQPYWYDPGSSSGGQDFTSVKYAISTVATLATDVTAIVGEPEIGAVITSVGAFINDVISLFESSPTVTGPSFGKWDDPQTLILKRKDLQLYTKDGNHTHSFSAGNKFPDITFGGTLTWHVTFVFKRILE